MSTSYPHSAHARVLILFDRYVISLVKTKRSDKRTEGGEDERRKKNITWWEEYFKIGEKRNKTKWWKIETGKSYAILIMIHDNDIDDDALIAFSTEWRDGAYLMANPKVTLATSMQISSNSTMPARIQHSNPHVQNRLLPSKNQLW